MEREYMLIGQGVAVSEAEADGTFFVRVKPKATETLDNTDLSSTGKTYLLAKTQGGYANLGRGKKIMVTMIIDKKVADSIRESATPPLKTELVKKAK